MHRSYIHGRAVGRPRAPRDLIAAAVLVAGTLTTGCDWYEPVNDQAFGLAQGEMVVYRAGHAVPESELFDLGDPADLGGTVLDGNPRISARIDYSEDGVTAGVFQATRGKVRIVFPFTEHATILKGKVTLTDETGCRRVFRPGDSYLIKQGSTILWEVKGPFVQKSFFNRVEPSDTPGPMRVYRKGNSVRSSDLVDLGDPIGLGGTVLDGNVAISARFDWMRDGLAGGIFQATRGDVLVDFPFTEHATVLAGRVTLTDEVGTRYRFKPGDSYLIRQASEISWEVDDRRVQKSFMSITAP